MALSVVAAILLDLKPSRQDQGHVGTSVIFVRPKTQHLPETLCFDLPGR